MAKINTGAIRAFQQKVHAMNQSNQREIRLTAAEARNLSHELSQITALAVQEYSSATAAEKIEFEISSKKF